MSPISLSLDVLLMILLIAALGFGWRLERRLKTLRESHADFAKAVGDLDRAAARAETGLAQLRQATDEAVDLLAGRIEKARELTTKLDRMTQEAAQVAERAPTPRAAAAVEAPRATAQRAAAERPLARQASGGRATPTDAVLAAERLARRLSGDDSLVLRTPAAPAPQRSRRLDDDELFEAAPKALAGGVGRMRR